MMIVQFIILLLIQYVHMINIYQVRVSIDSSNSWIVQNNNEGFIIDCGCYWEHGLILGQTWKQKFSDGKLPSFIFLTHTHPDNILGLVSLLNELNITELPVYVSNSGALNEMNYWLEIWRRLSLGFALLCSFHLLLECEFSRHAVSGVDATQSLLCFQFSGIARQVVLPQYKFLCSGCVEGELPANADLWFALGYQSCAFSQQDFARGKRGQ